MNNFPSEVLESRVVPVTADMLSAEYAKAADDVWKTLSAIDVNDHTEKKNGLTYLSWAWAYQTIMKHYPTFGYAFAEPEVFSDGSVEVQCMCWVIHDGHLIRKHMWLPVMNYANKPVMQPDSTEINKAKMRCLTKCISMLGLGAYIYAGEDLPQAPAASDKPAAKPEPKKVPAKKKVAKKKAPAKKAAPKKATPEPDDEQPVIDTEEEAENVADTILDLAKMHTDSVDSLRGFWRKNAKVIDLLDQQYPDAYAKLKSGFMEISRKVAEEEEDDDE